MARVWASWRFWFEGESVLAEESGDQSGPSLDAVQLVPHRGGELAGGARPAACGAVSGTSCRGAGLLSFRQLDRRGYKK